MRLPATLYNDTHLHLEALMNDYSRERKRKTTALAVLVQSTNIDVLTMCTYRKPDQVNPPAVSQPVWSWLTVQYVSGHGACMVLLCFQSNASALELW